MKEKGKKKVASDVAVLLMKNDHCHENRQIHGEIVIFMGVFKLTKTDDFHDGLWSTLMKIRFRDGIYITLMKTIIFMRVYFPLSRKAAPLTKYLFSGSVY
jgi:hypothetical protein